MVFILLLILAAVAEVFRDESFLRAVWSEYFSGEPRSPLERAFRRFQRR